MAKNVAEMSMHELQGFVNYAIEKRSVLNDLKGYRKYDISIFDGCQNEIQIDNKMRTIISNM